ncbi:MAG: hypothetical protein ACJ751_11425 [Niastella sp.]|uniref:hypothetical protein n=1 Tax=Niastella sp. TaxID=1869183 RepID=UPI0038997E35
MEVLKKVAEEFFGNEFECKIYSNGITLASKDNSKAFCFGLMSYDSSFRIRENVYAIKNFEEVESILQPLLKKYKVSQGDFEMGMYGVDYKGTIKKGMPMKEIAGVDTSFIEDMTNIDGGDEAQIVRVLSEFKKVIVYLEDEFINRYKTLQQVYEALKSMTPKERGELLMMPSPIKRMVIDVLCVPPADLDSMFESAIADFKEAEKEHSVFKNYYKVVEGLYHYFKSQKT